MNNIETSNHRGDDHTPSTVVPAVDVIEDASGITLFADIPGVSRDRLNLHVEHDLLIIEGDIDDSVKTGTESRHAEVDAQRYRRTFTLSKELDAERISAQLNQGVLKLHVPKAEHAQPKRIDVTIN